MIDVQGRRDEIIHRRGASDMDASGSVKVSPETKRYRDAARQTGCTKLKLANNCFSSGRVLQTKTKRGETCDLRFSVVA